MSQYDLEMLMFKKSMFQIAKLLYYIQPRAYRAATKNIFLIHV